MSFLFSSFSNFHGMFPRLFFFQFRWNVCFFFKTDTMQNRNPKFTQKFFTRYPRLYNRKSNVICVLSRKMWEMKNKMQLGISPSQHTNQSLRNVFVYDDLVELKYPYKIQRTKPVTVSSLERPDGATFGRYTITNGTCYGSIFTDNRTTARHRQWILLPSNASRPALGPTKSSVE